MTITVDTLLAELEELGHPQVRATYKRHGADGPMFGLRLADLDALVRRHRGPQAHELARALWATGNLDAQLLAAKLGDPQQSSSAELDRWARACSWPMAVDIFVADFVIRSPLALDKAGRWRRSKAEYVGRAGWTLVAGLARDAAIADEVFVACLAEIRRGIRSAANRKREAMNTALIAIGCHRQALRDEALAVADAIGPVEIDQGETNCETPDARASIEKAAAHQLRQAKRAAKKKAAQKKVAKKAANKKARG